MVYGLWSVWWSNYNGLDNTVYCIVPDLASWSHDNSTSSNSARTVFYYHSHSLPFPSINSHIQCPTKFPRESGKRSWPLIQLVTSFTVQYRSRRRRARRILVVSSRRVVTTRLSLTSSRLCVTWSFVQRPGPAADRALPSSAACVAGQAPRRLVGRSPHGCDVRWRHADGRDGRPVSLGY